MIRYGGQAILPVEDVVVPLRTGMIACPTPQPVAVSIVVVTWNSARWIERCLRSIPAACEGLAYEVIVHDNASGDATLALVPGDVSVIRSVQNDGFAAGVNRSLAASSGRYVFLLNPDCELAPRALTHLVAFLEQTPHAAAAAPLLGDERGDSQREFQLRRLPTLGTFAHEVLMLDKLFPRNRTTAHYRYRDADLTHPLRIEQPAAAALLIRRSVFDEIGPLDERFSPAWFEDVDYCRRLAAAGKEIFVVPAATARHYGGASLEHFGFARFVDVWYRNMWLYARKWLPAAQAEALRWMIIAGMLLRCAASLAGFRHPAGRWTAFRAFAAVLKKAFTRWDDGSASSS
jgi:N-acetylglucosaminyl-diphospho-decaprenol L-rhamnosyltransferase